MAEATTAEVNDDKLTFIMDDEEFLTRKGAMKEMKNYGRMHRAETMYAIIYPFRDALKKDCPKKVQLILMVNRWINPWHALQELSKEIPFSRRKKLEL